MAMLVITRGYMITINPSILCMSPHPTGPRFILQATLEGHPPRGAKWAHPERRLPRLLNCRGDKSLVALQYTKSLQWRNHHF